MAFTPLDPLSSVIASYPATFSGFHALAVNHTRRWARCAPFGLPTRNVRSSVRVNAIDAADWLRANYGTGIPLNKLLTIGRAAPIVPLNS